MLNEITTFHELATPYHMIRNIQYSDILARPDLIAEYAAECSIPEIGETNPQGETYAQLEYMGLVQPFGAFADGHLVGFCCVLTSVLPHYGRKVATIESLFVAKAHRKDGYGAELMDAVEEFARKSGCVAILYSAPTGSQLERLLTLRKSYRQTNTVFCRSLA